MTMDGLTSLLVNVGVGGAMTMALIWFLWQLLTKTFPTMLQVFREELAAQRASSDRLAAEDRLQRAQEHIALLVSVRELRDAVVDGQSKLLDRIDYGFKEMLHEIDEERVRRRERETRSGTGRWPFPPDPGPAS